MAGSKSNHRQSGNPKMGKSNSTSSSLGRQPQRADEVVGSATGHPSDFCGKNHITHTYFNVFVGNDSKIPEKEWFPPETVSPPEEIWSGLLGWRLTASPISRSPSERKAFKVRGWDERSPLPHFQLHWINMDRKRFAPTRERRPSGKMRDSRHDAVERLRVPQP